MKKIYCHCFCMRFVSFNEMVFLQSTFFVRLITIAAAQVLEITLTHFDPTKMLRLLVEN